jgi:ABC-type multidrug transport system fused ATPase/permease subunit
VSVSHLTVRYRAELAPVLKDLSFHIPPGTKVGVVGRTGE